MTSTRSRVVLAALAALALGGAGAPAAAQSDILLQLRSGSPAGDRFRIDSAGGVVAIGQLGIGIIPATGCGYRMMWYPYRGSFRAGSTDDNGACTYWDDANHGFYSWAGGNLTTASSYATFAFGDRAVASNQYAIAFGQQTEASGAYSFAHGYQSRCQGNYCFSHGYRANADGQAAVAIGYYSTADADYSMAFGYRASTNGRTGARVFADASTTDSIEAVANNEFAVRAAGGFRFRSNATLTNGCNIAAGGASITCSSSRTLKENFLTVDGEDVLRRVRAVPVNTWNYVDEGRQSRHLGPFAEDFWREFGLGSDPLAIGHLDIDGVNFAGVQALERRTAEQAERIRALEAELAELREMVRALGTP